MRERETGRQTEGEKERQRKKGGKRGEREKQSRQTKFITDHLSF